MQTKRVPLLVLGIAAVIGVSGLTAWLVALWWSPGAVTPAPLNTATILQRVQALSQLVTVKYVLEKTVVLDDPKYLGGLIPLGENRLILLAHGEVKAGVDLSKLQPGDVSVSGRRIALTLSRAVMTDAYLVEQHTRVLDWKTGLFRSFDKELEQTARRYALSEITRAARQSGIEEEATERARQQLADFLTAFGFESVEVRSRSK
ncbi:MAG: DUF4230 domain-containing protein [Verrucomicrobia bacterium]|nr:DUF4230 domain-containing protein [Verrucomicrobiota bacterium]